jgi:hypothetical protein
MVSVRFAPTSQVTADPALYSPLIVRFLLSEAMAIVAEPAMPVCMMTGLTFELLITMSVARPLCRVRLPMPK